MLSGESTSYFRCIKNLTTKLSFYFIRSVALHAQCWPCQFVYKCNWSIRVSREDKSSWINCLKSSGKSDYYLIMSITVILTVSFSFIRFPDVEFLTSVNDLGVVLDENLDMDEQIGNTCRSCYYHLRQIRSIRHSLSDVAARMAIQAFVTSRIDYCNAALLGLSSASIDRVQHVMNSGGSPAPEAAEILTNICSNEGRAALASCFSTDPVQGYSHDVEVCRWVRAGLSARSLPPTLHNLRPSTNTILRGKSFPARSSTSQNCDNAEKGFRLCRSDPVEQYAWDNPFVRSACQSRYN